MDAPQIDMYGPIKYYYFIHFRALPTQSTEIAHVKETHGIHLKLQHHEQFCFGIIRSECPVWYSLSHHKAPESGIKGGVFYKSTKLVWIRCKRQTQLFIYRKSYIWEAKWIKLTCWVPQGSCQVSLLFNIYMLQQTHHRRFTVNAHIYIHLHLMTKGS